MSKKSSILYGNCFKYGAFICGQAPTRLYGVDGGFYFRLGRTPADDGEF